MRAYNNVDSISTFRFFTHASWFQLTKPPLIFVLVPAPMWITKHRTNTLLSVKARKQKVANTLTVSNVLIGERKYARHSHWRILSIYFCSTYVFEVKMK